MSSPSTTPLPPLPPTKVTCFKDPDEADEVLGVVERAILNDQPDTAVFYSKELNKFVFYTKIDNKTSLKHWPLYGVEELWVVMNELEPIGFEGD